MTSILRSRHGWQQGRSQHGKMASRRSRDGAELIGGRDMGGIREGRDLDFWCRDLEIPLWTEMRSRHEIDVAT